METDILTFLAYFVPALFTGLIAYYIFNLHIKNEDSRRRFEILKDNQKQVLPIRLQAYERMTLFTERITPSKLIVRVAPTSNDKNQYESLLIQNIETEYEHNLSQQIYLTDDCWNVIKATKNATIQIIRKVSMSEKVDSANKLREAVLNEFMDKQSPSITALQYIKKEVSDLF